MAAGHAAGGTGRRRLVIWRHGETDHNASGIWQGQLDTHLSDRGREQARAAAAALAAYRPAVVVASDLRRAAETGRALAELVGLPIRYDERLREIHAGEWQGMTAGDVAEQYPEEQAALAAGEDLPRGIHGETVSQVAVRAREAVDEVIAGLGAGECAVIATHGVSGRAVVASLVGLDQHAAWMSIAGLRNCHWADVREYDRGWRIVGWNVGAEAPTAR